MDIGRTKKTVVITPLEEPVGRPKEQPARTAPAPQPAAPEREKVPA